MKIILKTNVKKLLLIQRSNISTANDVIRSWVPKKCILMSGMFELHFHSIFNNSQGPNV